jgi:hypothetical protein
LSLLGVAFSSFLIHGGVGLNCVGGHTRAPAKPGESGVYDGGGACDMLRARGSCIPRSGGGIHHGVCSVLRVGVWCYITPISLLFAAVLWPRVASLDPSGIMHMAPFVTLCEAYMGIDPTSIYGTTSFAPGYSRARA